MNKKDKRYLIDCANEEKTKGKNQGNRKETRTNTNPTTNKTKVTLLMCYKSALRQWCKHHGIDHRAFSDDELIAMRVKNRRIN